MWELRLLGQSLRFCWVCGGDFFGAQSCSLQSGRCLWLPRDLLRYAGLFCTIHPTSSCRPRVQELDPGRDLPHLVWVPRKVHWAASFWGLEVNCLLDQHLAMILCELAPWTFGLLSLSHMDLFQI